MIDLHCHLLPYVDDGANDLNTAMKLLREEARQRVKALCLTPHLRKGMFETSDEEIIRQYRRFHPLAKEAGIAAFLSREYHWDRGFREKLRERDVLTMGKGNVLLVEFSSLHSREQILEGVETVCRAGYCPLIAHVERYPAVDLETAERLTQRGALLQINAGSLLGEEGRRQKKISRKLVERGLAYVVASDAHDPEERRPNLEEARQVLGKRYGREQAKALLEENPLRILRGTV